MRKIHSNPALAVFLVVALTGAAGLAGCGGAGDPAADSSGGQPAPARVASADVTYYFLPG